MGSWAGMQGTAAGLRDGRRSSLCPFDRLLRHGRALQTRLRPSCRRQAVADSCSLCCNLGCSGCLVHRVVVMTLERSASRRRSFLQQLQRFPCLVDRLEWLAAVDGTGFTLDDVSLNTVSSHGLGDARTPRRRVLGYVLTRGAVGLACTLHAALVSIARDVDEGHLYLLCEDDAVLSPDFPKALRSLLDCVESHDPQWEVLHVGYNRGCTTIEPCRHEECRVEGRLCGLGVPSELFGMYALLLPPRGARALLRGLFPVSLQVDTELSRLYRGLAKSSYQDAASRAAAAVPARGPTLRVFAPRDDGGATSSARRWPGPLVVAPSSTAEATDIQVLSDVNFSQQYGLEVCTATVC